MVTTPIDPIRMPTINLSMEEIDEIQVRMERGELPPDFLDRHFDAVDANVFGIDAAKNKQGDRIEQGLGSSKNQTRNSVEAFRRFCKSEPGYEATLTRMEAELAKCDEARKANTPRAKWNKKRGRKTA